LGVVTIVKPDMHETAVGTGSERLKEEGGTATRPSRSININFVACKARASAGAEIKDNNNRRDRQATTPGLSEFETSEYGDFQRTRQRRRQR
jgi:hypothetical protein